MRSQDSTRQQPASLEFGVRTPGSSAFKSLRVDSRFLFACIRGYFCVLCALLRLSRIPLPICVNLRLSAVEFSCLALLREISFFRIRA
jgi:hypothetical protein